jgi:hypothetical protein
VYVLLTGGRGGGAKKRQCSTWAYKLYWPAFGMRYAGENDAFVTLT